MSDQSNLEALPRREAQVGPLTLHRLLPVRGRRMIGPWCFLDRYGPLTFRADTPMDVAPHPHIGLQTVSWLFEGEIIHNDSLGSECLVGPGHLSLMTAGRGIAHSEQTPLDNSGKLNGVQLWVALPDAVRSMAPEFQCATDLGVLERSGGLATVILGDIAGQQSPGKLHSPGVGADIVVHKASRLDVPLRKSFEHGVMLASGDAIVNGTRLEKDTLYFVVLAGEVPGEDELRISSATGARLLLIGGEPFGETVLMWWNFVARTPEEIAEARTRWDKHELAGEVPKYAGPRIEAPELSMRIVASKK
jgi:quercetin 2,3-dioxygenase